MTDVKMRYNPEAAEVELVYGDSVALSSGKEVFESWAKHWAETNNYVPKPEEPVVEETPPPPAPEPESTPPPVDNGEQV